MNYLQDIRKLSRIVSLFVTILMTTFLSAPAFAQGDPSINGPWTSTDIWVDNDGDGIEGPNEPAKGQTNQLFANIRNIDTSPVTDATVRFAYAPYGIWTWADYSDFLEIDVATGVDLGASGTADDGKQVSATWDLSDLTEDNGGAWGGYTIADFDHYCVWVKIEYSSDTNPGNNDAKKNFTQVPILAGMQRAIPFMLANPGQENAAGILEMDGLPRGWEFNLEGAELGHFNLKPGEFRRVVLTLFPPEDPQALQGRVDLGVIVNGERLGGLSFDIVDAEQPQVDAFPPAGGVLSAYLTGTWELRKRRSTVLQLVNPTGQDLAVLVAFFDDNEKPLKCVKDKLSANDLLEVDVKRYLDGGFGVVKIVSWSADGSRPQPGLVGFQRTFGKTFWCGTRVQAESPLQPIPDEILQGDLAIITSACH
jgi:hypothetical protein